MPKMNDDELGVLLDSLVKDCTSYRDATLMPARVKAQEYYDGTMNDTPSDVGRSKVVSRDVRAAIKKVMPSIVRTILGNDKVVEYEPVAQGDEATSEQATTYINNVVFPESGGVDALKDAIHDALLLRNGVLKWWFEEKIEITETEHSGLDDMSFADLVNTDDVTVLEHSAREEVIQTAGPDGAMVDVPSISHDARIRRQSVVRKVRVACIPLEEFLIHPDALCIEDALVVGQKTRLTRSYLISIGYDREKIDALSTAKDDTSRDTEETARRGLVEDAEAHSKANEEIDYYELYARIDFDGDGIAELRRICTAGGLKEENILSNDVCDEVPMSDVVCERRPHQWEGQSLFDDIYDIQRIKTVLLRSTLDNLYWQNNLQPTIQNNAVTNMESITDRNFGQPIITKEGIPVGDAVGYATVPFIAGESFQMLGYMDEIVTDRTGISDASSGLAPDALQNMTAKASAMVEQAGIGQTEMIVRTIANGGIKRMFKGLLKLIIQHQDKPRTVRLSGKWVTFDPCSWNANMDASVNIGLGAGTRERDMMMMSHIIGLQEKLLASFGPDNPYVKPDNLYNSIAKQVEAAGLKTPDLYFTKPDDAEIKQKLEDQKNQPSPEEQKTKSLMELEQFKASNQMALQDKKMQADASKERAQMEADLQVRLAELEKETEARRQELIISERKEQQKLDFEREKLAAEIALKREQMDREDARAVIARETEIMRTQAMEFSKAFSGQPGTQHEAQ